MILFALIFKLDIAALELYLPLLCGASILLATRDQVQDGRRLHALVRNDGITVLQAPAEQLPFPDRAFDAALAQLVVHFMSAPVAGLVEMAGEDVEHVHEPAHLAPERLGAGADATVNGRRWRGRVYFAEGCDSGAGCGHRE